MDCEIDKSLKIHTKTIISYFKKTSVQNTNNIMYLGHWD